MKVMLDCPNMAALEQLRVCFINSMSVIKQVFNTRLLITLEAWEEMQDGLPDLDLREGMSFPPSSTTMRLSPPVSAATLFFVPTLCNSKIIFGKD